MTEVKDINTLTYKYKGGFMVDIIVTKDEFEAWIYHKNYGIKMLMWGEPKKNFRFGKPYTQTFNDFKELVEFNIDEYAESYAEEYFD